MKKTISTILIGLMFLAYVVFPAGGTLPAAEAAAGQFSDISNHWAKEAILQAVKKGYVSGYPNGTFQPNKEVSRAEFIKMLVDALKLPHSQVGKPWYQPYVAAAIETGVHQQMDFKTDYNKPLTRLEMVRIAVRGTDKQLKESKQTLKDGEFLYRATKSGILQGMANGELNLEGTTTRAQAVAIIERILTLNEGKELPVDRRAISYAEVEATGTNIQTMWGVPAKPLPLKVDLGSRLDISIDKLLIVDMESKSGAYREWFPEVMMDTHEIANKHYVVAMHVNIQNNNMKEHAIWDFTFKIGGSEYNFRRSAITPNYKDLTPIKIVPSLWLDKTKTVEGWYLMSIPKNLVDIEKNKDVYFYDMPHQQRIYLTPQK